MTYRVIVAALALCSACGGSGDGPTGSQPQTTTYRVYVYNRSGYATASTLESFITVVVRTPTGSPGPSVPGVVVRFRATGGTLSAPRDTTDTLGLASIHWSVPSPFARADSLFACATDPDTAACSGTEIDHVTP